MKKIFKCFILFLLKWSPIFLMMAYVYFFDNEKAILCGVSMLVSAKICEIWQ